VSTVIARVIARTDQVAAISVVANGQDALNAYEQHGADLIVTDRHMPEVGSPLSLYSKDIWLFKTCRGRLNVGLA
jgi:CheY-like chemotaxis protein